MTIHRPMTPWNVAQTKPIGCAMAERQLARQGFRRFVPSEEWRYRHSRKFYTSVHPLFPGYIFVSFDPTTARWRAINGPGGDEVGQLSSRRAGASPLGADLGADEALR